MSPLPQVLMMGPTPVKDDTDMRGLVGTLVADGVVRAFCSYVNQVFLLHVDEKGTVVRKEVFGPYHDYPEPKVGITYRYEEVHGLTLEPYVALDFCENESSHQAAFILASPNEDARDHYHLRFISQPEHPDAKRIQLVHRGCSLDRIVRARWEPQKLTTLDEEGRLVIPDDLIEARLDVRYTERSTERDGKFRVLAVERSIMAYGAVDTVFKALIDRVIASDV